MSIRSKVRSFISRARYAWVNARASQKFFKENGYVRLPNGSVIVHPRHSLNEFEVIVHPRHSLNEFEDED